MLMRHMGIGVGHIHQTARNMEAALQDLDGETAEEREIRESAERDWERRMDEGTEEEVEEDEAEEEEEEGESEDELNDNDTGYDNL